MNASTIKHEAQRIKAQYHTNDLMEICRQRRIRVLHEPMGKHPGSCKGFYLRNYRCKVIVLNSDLEEWVQRIVLAHELGHDVLHSRHATTVRFHEFSIMDNTDIKEYEANVFVSAFLLEDERVLEELETQEGDFFHTAACLSVPPEILDFKLRLMREDGYDFKIPIESSGTFLRRDIRNALT